MQRGWGFAILNPVSYQKDDGSGLTEGIIGLANQGQPRKLEDWGVLKAWAWGAEQAKRYFETERRWMRSRWAWWVTRGLAKPCW